MVDDKSEIFTRLKSVLSSGVPRLRSDKDTEKRFDVCGKKRVKVGARDVNGMYFGSVIIQKNFVGFHFFPIYTHPMEFADLPDHLKKSLKGKSCFHVKQLDASLLKDIRAMVKKGLSIYRKTGWI